MAGIAGIASDSIVTGADGEEDTTVCTLGLEAELAIVSGGVSRGAELCTVSGVDEMVVINKVLNALRLITYCLSSSVMYSTDVLKAQASNPESTCRRSG